MSSSLPLEGSEDMTIDYEDKLLFDAPEDMMRHMAEGNTIEPEESNGNIKMFDINTK
jgi:hypothetical protein